MFVARAGIDEHRGFSVKPAKKVGAKYLLRQKSRRFSIKGKSFRTLKFLKRKMLVCFIFFSREILNEYPS